MYNIGDRVLIYDIGKRYRYYLSWFLSYYNNQGAMSLYKDTCIYRTIRNNEVVGTIIAKGLHTGRPKTDGMIYAIRSDNDIFLIAENGLSFVDHGFVVELI